MTVVAIVSTILALLLAASRFLETSKPLWKLMPPKFRVWLPIAALVLPQLSAAAVAAETPADLLNLGFLAAALYVPGVVARDQNDNGVPDEEEEDI